MNYYFSRAKMPRHRDTRLHNTREAIRQQSELTVLFLVCQLFNRNVSVDMVWEPEGTNKMLFTLFFLQDGLEQVGIDFYA